MDEQEIETEEVDKEDDSSRVMKPIDKFPDILRVK